MHLWTYTISDVAQLEPPLPIKHQPLHSAAGQLQPSPTHSQKYSAISQIMERMSLQFGTFYKYAKREYPRPHMCQAL